MQSFRHFYNTKMQIFRHFYNTKMQIFRHFYNLELQGYQVNQSKNKKASTFADAFSYIYL